ncbi:MAG: hypothetical protein JJU45_20370 [Acidimicrobiia bacterium]|nr:hypothetical protein [Acidimicrobiia bacterium]
MRKLAILGATMCLLLAACGDDDSEDARSEIAAALLEGGADEDVQLDAAQADCLAGAMVAEYGEDQARQLADDPDDFERMFDDMDIQEAIAAAQAMGQMFIDCGIEDVVDADEMAELEDALEQLDELDIDLDEIQAEIEAEQNR